MNNAKQNVKFTAALHSSDGECGLFPTVMTEDELICLLRIPEISRARNHRDVIENLKRTRGLPRVYLCGRAVYPTEAVKAWLENHITCGQ